MDRNFRVLCNGLRRVGRALAEWIVHGEYRRPNLSPLDFSRTLRTAPMREANVI